MRDPFQPQTNQLLREAQIAILIVTLLVGLLCYVGYMRMSNMGRQVPDHVRTAPLAEAVWPGERPETADLNRGFQPPLPSSAATPEKTMASDVRSIQPKSMTPSRPEPTRDRITEINRRAVETQATLIRQQEKLDALVASTQPTPRNLNPKIDTLVQPTALSVSDALTPNIRAEHAANNIPDSQSIRRAPSEFVPLPKAASLLPAPTRSKASDAIPAASPIMIAPRPICRPHEPDSGSALSNHSRTDSAGFKPIPKKIAKPNAKSSLDSARESSSAFQQMPRGAAALPPLRRPQAHQPETNVKPKLSRQTFKQQDAPKPPPRKQTPAKTVSASSDSSGHAKLDSAVETKNHHTVEEGDSLWSIAQQHYGDGQYFRALHAFNEVGSGSDDLLTSGTQIAIPDVSTLKSRWPELCPSHLGAEVVAADASGSFELVTRPGDTLFDIARNRLGQASRYVEIIALNKNRIRPTTQSTTPLRGGIRLQLPTE